VSRGGKTSAAGDDGRKQGKKEKKKQEHAAKNAIRHGAGLFDVFIENTYGKVKASPAVEESDDGDLLVTAAPFWNVYLPRISGVSFAVHSAPADSPVPSNRIMPAIVNASIGIVVIGGRPLSERDAHGPSCYIRTDSRWIGLPQSPEFGSFIWGHSAALDLSNPQSPSVLVFGGKYAASSSGIEVQNTRMQRLNMIFGDWIEESVSGDVPTSRSFHGSCVDPRNKSYLAIQGGISEAGVDLNDMFLYHFEEKRWEQVFRNNRDLPAVEGHSLSMLWDDISGSAKILLFGGYDGLTMRNDVVLIDLPANAERRVKVLPVTGIRPSGRKFHSAIAAGNFLIVMGGMSSTSILNDIWTFNLETCVWTEHRSTASIPPICCSGFCAARVLSSGCSMISIGGQTVDESGQRAPVPMDLIEFEFHR